MRQRLKFCPVFTQPTESHLASLARVRAGHARAVDEWLVDAPPAVRRTLTRKGPAGEPMRRHGFPPSQAAVSQRHLCGQAVQDGGPRPRPNISQVWDSPRPIRGSTLLRADSANLRMIIVCDEGTAQAWQPHRCANSASNAPPISLADSKPGNDSAIKPKWMQWRVDRHPGFGACLGGAAAAESPAAKTWTAVGSSSKPRSSGLAIQRPYPAGRLRACP